MILRVALGWLVATLIVLTTGIAAPADRIVHDIRGGVLYLSLAPELEFSYSGRYCGLSATPLPSEAMLSIPPSRKPRIAYLICAWPDSARPEIGAVTFGIRYTDGINILRWGVCQNVLQAATSNWPASGEGMAIAMAGHADTSRVIELAWMAIDAPVPGTIEITPHPDPQLAARFATSTVPVEAPIVDLGSIGFGRPGRAPVSVFPGPTTAATCVFDSLCALLTEAEAAYYGELAVYLGPGVACEPGICRPEAPAGACCLPEGRCAYVSRKECAARKGAFLGEGSDCDPDPCPPSGGGSGGGKEGAE